MVYRVLNVFVEVPEIEARYCHSFLLSWRTAASLIIPVPSISSKLASIHSNNVSALGERQLPRWDQDGFLKENQWFRRSIVPWTDSNRNRSRVFSSFSRVLASSTRRTVSNRVFSPRAPFVKSRTDEHFRWTTYFG